MSRRDATFRTIDYRVEVVSFGAPVDGVLTGAPSDVLARVPLP